MMPPTSSSSSWPHVRRLTGGCNVCFWDFQRNSRKPAIDVVHACFCSCRTFAVSFNLYGCILSFSVYFNVNYDGRYTSFDDFINACCQNGFTLFDCVASESTARARVEFT